MRIVVNLIEILKFVNSDTKGKSWKEIKDYFKWDKDESDHISDMYFHEVKSGKHPYFIEHHEKNEHGITDQKWRLSAKGIEYLDKEKRRKTQDKLTISNYILTSVLVLATVISVIFTIVSSAPLITGSQPICPSQIDGTISYIRQYGNYGKTTSSLSYEFEGTNIVAYETVHPSSVAGGFKPYVPGTFPLPPIDLNGNKQTDIEFVMRIENESVSNAKFKLSFTYMRLTFPIAIFDQDGPQVCEYKKNETGVLSLHKEYNEIGLFRLLLFIDIIIIGILVIIIVFILMNRIGKDWRPKQISQSSEIKSEPVSKKKTIFGLKRKTFRDFWISLIAGFTGGAIVNISNSGMPLYLVVITFFIFMGISIGLLKAVDE